METGLYALLCVLGVGEKTCYQFDAFLVVWKQCVSYVLCGIGVGVHDVLLDVMF